MRLDDQLLRDAKAVATSEGITLTALISESLRERVSRRQGNRVAKPASLPIHSGGGLQEGLDPDIIHHNEQLADLMDGLE